AEAEYSLHDSNWNGSRNSSRSDSEVRTLSAPISDANCSTAAANSSWETPGGSRTGVLCWVAMPGIRPSGCRYVKRPRASGAGRASKGPREPPGGVADQAPVDVGVGDAALRELREDHVRDVEVVGVLVGEHRVADHEVVEGGAVVREVDLVDQARLEHLRHRL